ncbi:MAG TPA: hypothetical protein VEB20_02060 [Azospirillaceae bacterium]|nr:hypothetical protein [Azospirillaceae bacterium]
MAFVTLQDTDNRQIAVNSDAIRSVTKWRDRDEKPTVMIRYINGDSEHVFGAYEEVVAMLNAKK